MRKQTKKQKKHLAALGVEDAEVQVVAIGAG
jgi:hypothetical protein